MNHAQFIVRRLEPEDESKFGTFMVPATTKYGQLMDLELPFIEIVEIFNQIVDQLQNEILEAQQVG